MSASRTKLWLQRSSSLLLWGRSRPRSGRRRALHGPVHVQGYHARERIKSGCRDRIHPWHLRGKVRAAKFNIETLQQQTDAFIERCLDNPGEKAMDAMTKVKN